MLVLVIVAVVRVPAARPVLVLVASGGIMTMHVIVPMMCIIVSVMVVPVAMVLVPVIVAAGIVGAALGAERALDGRRRAALAADHLGEDVIVLDPDRVGADLGRGVPVADVPGDAHEAQRVLGPDLEEPLRRCPHRDEAPVLEPHGVAVVEGDRLVEVEEEVEPALSLQGHAAAVAPFVVEDDRVGDPVGLHGGLADDGGGAEHGFCQVYSGPVQS
jgi:hypothetical protein